MKPTAVIINLGRGPVIDEKALLAHFPWPDQRSALMSLTRNVAARASFLRAGKRAAFSALRGSYARLAGAVHFLERRSMSEPSLRSAMFVDTSKRSDRLFDRSCVLDRRKWTAPASRAYDPRSAEKAARFPARRKDARAATVPRQKTSSAAPLIRPRESASSSAFSSITGPRPRLMMTAVASWRRAPPLESFRAFPGSKVWRPPHSRSATAFRCDHLECTSARRSGPRRATRGGLTARTSFPGAAPGWRLHDRCRRIRRFQPLVRRWHHIKGLPRAGHLVADHAAEILAKYKMAARANSPSDGLYRPRPLVSVMEFSIRSETAFFQPYGAGMHPLEVGARTDHVSQQFERTRPVEKDRSIGSLFCRMPLLNFRRQLCPRPQLIQHCQLSLGRIRQHQDQVISHAEKNGTGQTGAQSRLPAPTLLALAQHPCERLTSQSDGHLQYIASHFSSD